MFGFFGGIALFLAVFYFCLLMSYVIGWQLCPIIEVPPLFVPSQKISVIVPARNEALYIEKCVRSILNNQFPQNLLQLIVINDHSTDETAPILTSLQLEFSNLEVIHLAQHIKQGIQLNSYKKYALNLAIEQATGTFIVTTDADCVVPVQWLRNFSFMFEVKAANFVTAPVVFYNQKNSFQQFQTLDFMGMMCITGASLHWKWAAMSNGANLGYPKAIFKAVNGFQGVDKLASGDDLLLMEKILKHTQNQGIFFLKTQQAIVETIAAQTLNEFFNQRVRWASKSQVYQGWGIKFALAMVLLFNFWILIGFFLCLFGSISGQAFGLSFAIKLLTDFIFLFFSSLFFKRAHLMAYFLPAQIWHLLYICSVGVWGNFGSYQWKGRKVK